MSQLSPNARRLLDLARSEDVPSAALQARLERSLAQRLALGASGGGGTGLVGTAAGMPAATKTVVVLGVVAALGGGAWLGTRQFRAASAPPSAVIASGARIVEATAGADVGSATDIRVPAAPVEPPAERRAEPPRPSPASGSRATPGNRSTAANTSAPVPLPTTVAPTQDHALLNTDPHGAARATMAPAATTPRVDILQAETAALRDAQQALRSGNAQRALELLEQQDRAFASGALQEERAAARVLALCEALGPAGVTGEAARFERQYPRSALLARVRAACRGHR